MSRPASVDRGLQPERTVLAWTRTSLCVAVSGVLILLKDRSVSGLAEQHARIGIVGAAAVVVLAVSVTSVTRRRALAVRPLPQGSARASRAVPFAGLSILTLTLLTACYLLLPLR